MKINVVCHDLSNNCLGRAHVLARLLARTHDVDIVGRMRGDDLWEPLRCDASADSAVPLRVLPRGVGLRRAIAALDGDLVYAVKPKAGSLGLGLLARARSGIPLIAACGCYYRFSIYSTAPKRSLECSRGALACACWGTFAGTRRLTKSLARCC